MILALRGAGRERVPDRSHAAHDGDPADAAVMSEWAPAHVRARTFTPGRRSARAFIDHATGVVIGETAVWAIA